MNTELFIRRPVATILLMVSMILFGVIGYIRMPVSELPNVDFPTIRVSAGLSGASPETMASAVATPLENSLSSVAGITSMTSQSAQGSTSITLQFDLDRNIDAAFQDVQASVSSTLRKLPSDMKSPPTVRKTDPSARPVFYVFMKSQTLPMSTVTKYAEAQLARRLSTVSGVSEVRVYGARKFAVRLQMDPDAMAAMGLGIDEVAAAVSSTNTNMGTGSFSGSDLTALIRSEGQLYSAAEFESQVIAYRNGAPVRFGDIGQVIDGVENDDYSSSVGDSRSVTLAIVRLPGSNTIDVVDRIREILPTFQTSLPPGIDLQIFYDRSQTIRESIADVEFTLVLAAVLVVMVIFLFLRSLTATVIPAITLPICIIGTFAGMSALGLGLDNLSLMALTLSVGFVVDDAIVMLENVIRHREMGKSPFQAAIDGSREITFTIISMTFSLAAVFFPVMFMGGMVGRLLYEFSLTIVLAIFISGVVSLTLTPMMCGRMLRQQNEKHGQLYLAFERGFNRMQEAYAKSVHWSVDHKTIIVGLFFASIAATVYLYQITPKSFLPSSDSGRLTVFTEGETNASFEAMVTNQTKLAKIISKDPGVASVMSSIGTGGPRPTINAGFMVVSLKPYEERHKESADTIVRRLRKATANLPEIKAFIVNPPMINVGGRTSKAEYQYTLQDTDLKQLYEGAQKLTAALSEIPGFIDVNNDLNISASAVQVSINREQAAKVGVSPRQIEDALASAFSDREVSTIYAADDQYAVILELLPDYQKDSSALDRLYVRSSQGGLVPLSSVITISRGIVAQTINHQGQLPAVTISFNLGPGLVLGDALTQLQRVKDELQLSPTTVANFSGTAQAFAESTKDLGLLLVLAIAVVYIILGILYESFIHPLTILSGLPSAAVGALITLLIFDTPLSLYAFVGIIMLVGIVKKNAIMMIDFALQQERKLGKPPNDAIVEAAIIRFRPIMMTTMAALAGALPIAMAYGAGGEARQPLGLAVVGGLAVSQALTLYITPVLYILFDKIAHMYDKGQNS